MSFPRYLAYKDSGVAWLGDVPGHWDVVSFKQFVDIQNGADHKHIEPVEGYPVLGSGGVFTHGNVPPRALMRKIEREATKIAHEHLLVFTDAAQTMLTWLWVAVGGCGWRAPPASPPAPAPIPGTKTRAVKRCAKSCARSSGRWSKKKPSRSTPSSPA